MSTHSSGYYSIDTDYNIVGFNDTARQLYPRLTLGEKCYKALMGLDSPCPPCPVANRIHGPRTYLDPIRHIYETVDAVETVSPDGRRGHALVFSTVEEGERLASAIPTGENSLRLLGAINLLSTKYATVLGVNLQSKKASVYRCESLFGNREEQPLDDMPFESVVELLVSRYIHPEDRAYVGKSIELASVSTRLGEAASFKVHCRVLWGGLHYYYLLIARNGDAQSFEDFVIAIACEDDDINTRRIYENQLNVLLASVSRAAGYFHLDITEDRILRVGGTSSIVDGLNRDCSIDELMKSMAAYILKERDRRDFLRAYSQEAMKRDYESGRMEIVRESRCYYDDHVARWSRYTLRMFVNPSNGHIEGLFYGMDITQDREAYETQVSIVQTLSSNYLDVYLINTRERTASVIKRDGSISMPLEHGEQHTCPYEELVGDYIAGHVHPDDRAMMAIAMKLCNVLEALSERSEYAGNYRIIKDGKTHYYQFRFIKNEEYGIVVLGFLNVDSIVEAEIEQQKKLQAALDDARRANEEKSRFLARMSHDMRTPLNGMIGLLEIDRKHEDDVEYLKESRRKATVVANHLVSLINDVLDMARIEDGSLTLAHEAFNIIEQGREASVLINLQAQEMGIATATNLSALDERYTIVYGSPLHLRRALMNIYSNCIKYNKKNGRITTDIEVFPGERGRVIYRWTITDTGIGMSQDFLKRIFDPFVQAGTDARSVYQGSGLGMSIAKALIEQMGGTLEVSSELGVGSTFVVTIPFEIADRRDIRVMPEDEGGSIRGMKLLLVEDNDLNREIAETILLEEGADVTSVVNGLEAVNLMADSPADAFDLILMDVMMPVMDGHEATRRIRQMSRPEVASIPIVAMTANAFAEDIQQSLDAGMNDHIAKPLDVEQMLRMIARYRKRQ